MTTSYVHEMLSKEEDKEPMISSDHAEKGWKAIHFTQYQGFWIAIRVIPGIISCREHFNAYEDDVILGSMPKSGTTWLKALAFSIVNRTRHDLLHNHPLLTSNPHDLVPFIELNDYAKGQEYQAPLLPFPRLFASHLLYELLPTSTIQSNCRVVYLCRNPKDTFVSMWHFLNKLLPEDETPVPIEEAFELFCRGVSLGGPFWEHVLGYWKASLERPERVMFIKYEGLKEDPTFHLRRLAEFLGCPFSEEEEKERVVEKIERLCSLESLSSLEVNKGGKMRLGYPNKNFFRRGVVGDWKNHLTAEMIQRLDQLTLQKFGSFGLVFKDS